MQTTDFLVYLQRILSTNNLFGVMKKKYLLWGYAVVAICIIIILLAITVTSIAGAKGARNHMANPENRRGIYDTAAKVSRDTGLKIPEFLIKEHKPGEYLEGGQFRDTLIVFFYKGIPDSVFSSFEERAETIEKAREIGKDSCKSVEIDSINYHYQDFYVGGFSCYVGVQLAKNSPYGRIIFGNWKPAKK